MRWPLVCSHNLLRVKQLHKTSTDTVAVAMRVESLESVPVTLNVYSPAVIIFAEDEQAVTLPTATNNRIADNIDLHPRRRAGMPKNRQQANTALPAPNHLALLLPRASSAE